MEVAAEHAEAEGERSRIRMEERLLLDRIALEPADVTPRDEQLAAPIDADFADAHRPLGNRAFMAAGVAPQPVVADRFDELGRCLGCSLLENFGKRCHISIVRRL